MSADALRHILSRPGSPAKEPAKESAKDRRTDLRVTPLERLSPVVLDPTTPDVELARDSFGRVSMALTAMKLKLHGLIGTKIGACYFVDGLDDAMRAPVGFHVFVTLGDGKFGYRRGPGRTAAVCRSWDEYVKCVRSLVDMKSDSLPACARPRLADAAAASGEFDESKHPRDTAGKFTNSGSASDIPHPDTLDVGKTLGGSTGAKLAKSQSASYVIKQGASPGHVRNEFVANKAYQALDIKVPDARLDETKIGPVQTTQFIHGTPYSQLTSADRKVADSALRSSFVADAVLGNWDVIGKNNDNVIVKAGVPYRIDNGGALLYRAMGSLKSASQFGPQVTELKTMLDPKLNPSAAGVFKGITQDQIHQQAVTLLNKRDVLLNSIDDPKTREIMSQRLDWLKENVVDAADHGASVTNATPATPAAHAAAEVMQSNGKFDSSDYTFSKAVDVQHPAVHHITTQVRAALRDRKAAPIGSKKWFAADAKVAQLRADRKALWNKLGESGQLKAGGKSDVETPKSSSLSGVKKFETASDFADWVKKADESAASATSSGLPHPDKSALGGWTASSGGIRENQKNNADDGTPLSERTQNLEYSVSRAPAPKTGVPLYRGMTLVPADVAEKEFFTVGSVIRTKCHDSWTYSRTVADDFSPVASMYGSSKKKKYSIILKVDDAGKEFPTAGDLGKVGHENGAEKEVIVPKNVAYRVVDVHDMPNKGGLKKIVTVTTEGAE